MEKGDDHVHIHKHVQVVDGKEQVHTSTHKASDRKDIHTHTHTHVVTDASGHTHTTVTHHTHTVKK